MQSTGSLKVQPLRKEALQSCHVRQALSAQGESRLHALQEPGAPLEQADVTPVLRDDMAWEAAPLENAAVFVLLATIVLPGRRALQRIPVPLAPTLKLENLLRSA